MIFYKTIYLTYYIILCLMRYTNCGNLTEEQNKCIQNLRDDYNYPDKSLIRSKMTLPRRAFKDKELNQFQTLHGFYYFQKIVEKAATGLTNSPREFCKIKEFSILCMEQLHQVYKITDENDALSVIKWTYVYITESDIPKTFNALNGDKTERLEHYAIAYFNHMLVHLDFYVSLPWPVTFCQSVTPHRVFRNQNYRQITDGNPGESSGGEMTIKEQRRAAARQRKQSVPDK